MHHIRDGLQERLDQFFVENRYIIPVQRQLRFHHGNESFLEQMWLFAEAGIVVGVNGNGLNNMIFMPEGSHIISFEVGLFTMFTSILWGVMTDISYHKLLLDYSSWEDSTRCRALLDESAFEGIAAKHS